MVSVIVLSVIDRGFEPQMTVGANQRLKIVLNVSAAVIERFNLATSSHIKTSAQVTAL